MVRHVCFNCPKHNELMSLRAEVKKFEDGRETKRIIDERDKAVRKYKKSEDLCWKLAEENEKLKDENRSLKFSLKVTEGNYERLLSAYETQMAFYSEQELLQSDSFFERMESVISELNRKVVTQMEDNTEQAALIQKLKAQITKDNTNSSIPSSRLPITKLRQITERRPTENQAGRKATQDIQEKNLSHLKTFIVFLRLMKLSIILAMLLTAGYRRRVKPMTSVTSSKQAGPISSLKTEHLPDMLTQMRLRSRLRKTALSHLKVKA